MGKGGHESGRSACSGCTSGYGGEGGWRWQCLLGEICEIVDRGIVGMHHGGEKNDMMNGIELNCHC